MHIVRQHEKIRLKYDFRAQASIHGYYNWQNQSVKNMRNTPDSNVIHLPKLSVKTGKPSFLRINPMRRSDSEDDYKLPQTDLSRIN